MPLVAGPESQSRAHTGLSYTADVRVAELMKRRLLDPVELEFAFLFFLFVVPMGYWMLRTPLAIVGV